MTLAEWDERVKPNLRGIEKGAQLCADHVNQLVYRPAFTTLAEEELERLERLLAAALLKVNTAKTNYQRLPTDD